MARWSCGITYASSLVFTSCITSLFVSETAIGESTSGGTHSTVYSTRQRQATILDSSGMATLSPGVNSASGTTTEAATLSQDSIPSPKSCRKSGPWCDCSYRRRVDAFANMYSFLSCSSRHRKRQPSHSPSQDASGAGAPGGPSRNWYAVLKERVFDVDERVRTGVLSVGRLSGGLRGVSRYRLACFSWPTSRRTELKTLNSR